MLNRLLSRWSMSGRTAWWLRHVPAILLAPIVLGFFFAAATLWTFGTHAFWQEMAGRHITPFDWGTTQYHWAPWMLACMAMVWLAWGGWGLLVFLRGCIGLSRWSLKRLARKREREAPRFIPHIMTRMSMGLAVLLALGSLATLVALWRYTLLDLPFNWFAGPVYYRVAAARIAQPHQYVGSLLVAFIAWPLAWLMAHLSWSWTFVPTPFAKAVATEQFETTVPTTGVSRHLRGTLRAPTFHEAPWRLVRRGFVLLLLIVVVPGVALYTFVPKVPGIAWVAGPSPAVSNPLAPALYRNDWFHEDDRNTLPAGDSTLVFHLSGFVGCRQPGEDECCRFPVGLPNRVPIAADREYGLALWPYTVDEQVVITLCDEDIPPPDPAALAARERFVSLRLFTYPTATFTLEGFRRFVSWFPKAREVTLPGDCAQSFADALPALLPDVEEVAFNWDNDGTPVDCAFLRRFPQLRSVTWWACEVHPEALATVAALPVTSVTLSSAEQCSNDALRSLAASPYLQELSLYGFHSETEGRMAPLKLLAGLGVRRLAIEMDYKPVARSYWAQLLSMPRLEHLVLEETYVSPGNDLGALIEHPTLRELTLGGMPWDGDPLMGLAGHPRLERVTIEYWECSEKTLAWALATLPALREVEFGQHFAEAALLRSLRPEVIIVNPAEDR